MYGIYFAWRAWRRGHSMHPSNSSEPLFCFVCTLAPFPSSRVLHCQRRSTNHGPMDTNIPYLITSCHNPLPQLDRIGNVHLSLPAGASRAAHEPFGRISFVHVCGPWGRGGSWREMEWKGKERRVPDPPTSDHQPDESPSWPLAAGYVAWTKDGSER
ncbi:hypothetical protein BZA05DRAFT_383699 [Tricharina praecox]|uniref:uncharacterized protein n=1 Tax=Tricharina praecox TaxID=43433 RepID=UPI00221FB84E|nr:uncharacterized protein BZA05DRAFT_383699 [Tricharina praecox]KAI5859214.1 hypothetical protein BZA05DRAFT_383699 [Tricharina praecox]